MKLNPKKIITFTVLGFALIVLVTIFSFFIIDEMKGGAVGDGQVNYELIIDSGASSSTVVKELSSAGMIKSSVYFNYLIKFTRSGNKIKQGVYDINDGMSSRKILDLIVSGKVKLITFTVPEGYNNRQIGDLLVSKKLILSRETFLAAAANKAVLEKFKIPATTTEGYLFPETYSVPLNYPGDRIVEMMIKRFFKKLESIPEAKGISAKDLHAKVVLASIVEREAVRKEERPMMAGVFLTRIEKSINLESCATIQYLFDKPKKRLFETDLKIVSPYNTYMNSGWPPGPISNPGLPALLAAFKPEKSDKLFFLLKPDGSHYFSATFKEHLDAKKKFIDVLYQ
ncbi:endolytic transglycosylase MltG [Leptospira ognonensis]|uniref:Endolytic murein transglycosylase n=1 Tax=Leptospira ognonensis TaxID=2484945 RepID=A0A4R9KB50_9LEPT|nr:endolytic transglycosylase MltG [Leptospira ognonensis]TGL63075.1 endolytic transglycosylase MltG [Leptospira ognonensis]